MDNEIKSHFDKFYQRLIFSETVGKEEKTYNSNTYFNSTSDTISIIKEQVINDKYLYLNSNGVILKFMYGDGYNEKYSTLELFIYPDPYYKGDKKNIKDVLLLLNDYINNNYREYNKKINKIIYGIDNTKNVKIKYKKDNIFNIDYIKRVYIENLVITDEDIDLLMLYKNLKNITTRNCIYNVKNMYKLNTKNIIDFNSTIPSINIFNGIDVDSLYLSGTKILNNVIKNGTIKANYLKLENIDLNYELFFLLFNFIGVKELEIDEKILNDNELNFLKVFYEVNSITASGEARFLDFLNDLPELQFFYGDIKIIDPKYLQLLKKKYPNKFNFDRYFLGMKFKELIKCREFFEKIKLSKPYFVKWQGIIENSKEEDIKKRILYYNKLPLNVKKDLFKSENIELIQTKMKNAYKIIGIEIPEHNEFETNIIGPNGLKLCTQRKSYGISKIFPIFGPDGKILEQIEYQKEQDYIIPEYKLEFKNIVNSNNDNVFDYYYNHQLSYLEKYNHLKSCIENDEIFVRNSKYHILNESNNKLLKMIETLDKKILNIKNSINDYMIFSPHNEYKWITEEINGKKTEKSIEIKDPYLDITDFNLYSVVNRHRNIKCIERFLNEQFLNYNICKEEQNIVIKNILEYINILNEKDNIKSKIVEYTSIFESTIDNRYKSLIINLNKLDYKNWFINDIEQFLDKFNLTEHETKIFIKYILLKQCCELYKLEEKLANVNFAIERLEEVLPDYDYIINYLECENHIEAFNKGKISLDEKNNYDKYDTLIERKKYLTQKLNKYNYDYFRNIEYKKMIPLIDKLTCEELMNIKKNIVITNEFDNKFNKFVDYLYYYFYNDYPYWIKKELMMCHELPKKYESSITTTNFKEEKVHIYAKKRVIKQLPFV